MERYYKTIGLLLAAALLSVQLSRKEKDMAAVLAALACVLAAGAIMEYVAEIGDFLKELKNLGELDGGMLGILFKIAGISITAEIAGAVCTDCGNGSLGKMVQLTGRVAVIYLALPILRTLVELICETSGSG